MSVLIYAESADGKFKKAALELASYGKKLAETMGTTLAAVTVNTTQVEELGQYGVNQIFQVNHAKLEVFSAKAYAEVIKQVATQAGSTVVIVSSSTDSLYLAPLLAVGLDAGFASNVVDLPLSIAPFQVRRTAFSNKAFNITEITSTIKVLSIAKNSFGLEASTTSPTITHFTPQLDDSSFTVSVEATEKSTGKVTIADAEVVVSGGRGLKGPENWHLIENLASVLGAATACSKPVSDLGWRPHSEHVGQTGKPVASNLYVAVGISGAIQHIAGINSSKIKVVINADAEAPFFKVADYGVVGDAFEIVPKLTEKLRAFKAQNA
jgi:electron transfer flavoprotein alpha subunit